MGQGSCPLRQRAVLRPDDAAPSTACGILLHICIWRAEHSVGQLLRLFHLQRQAWLQQLACLYGDFCSFRKNFLHMQLTFALF